MNCETAIEIVRTAMLRDWKSWEAADCERPSPIAASRTIEILELVRELAMSEPADVDADAMGGFTIEWGDGQPFLDLTVCNDGSVIFVRDGAEVKAERVTDLRAVLETIGKTLRDEDERR